MRITQSMMVNNMAYWASQQANKLRDAQTVVGSGKKINKPSDDPLVAGKIMSDRVSISQDNQYVSNIAQAEIWKVASNITLDTVSSTLQYARDAVALFLPGGSSVPTEPIPTEATTSIKPTINLSSTAIAGDYPFSATVNVYDADLKAIPMTMEFTKVAPTVDSFTLNLSANSLAAGDTVTIGTQLYTAVDSYSDIAVDLTGVGVGDTVTVGGVPYTAVSGFTANATEFDCTSGITAAADLTLKIPANQPAYGASNIGTSVLTITGAALDDTSVTAGAASVTPTTGEFIISGNAIADATNLEAAIARHQLGGGVGKDYVVSRTTDTITIMPGILSPLTATTVSLGTASASDIAITSALSNTRRWSWAAAIPGADGTATGGGLLDFDAAGQLVAGTDPTITLTFPDLSTQTITWDLYSGTPGPTNGDLTQYAAKSSIGDNTENVTTGLLYDLYNQILALANTQNASGSGYMYSGNISNTMPFAKVSIDAGVQEDIVFDLGNVATKVDIQVINSAGTVVRNITIPDSLNPAAVTAGTKTISWNGQDDAGDQLPDGQYGIIVTAADGNGDAVAAYPSYGGDVGGKNVFTGANEIIVLNNNGKEIFSSLLSNLSQAIASINTMTDPPLNKTALAAEQVKLADILAALKSNSADLEAEQTKLYNAGIQLDGANTRLKQLITSTSNSVSDQEMGSPEEAAIKLQIQQNNYEQVMVVTANVLKLPKLSDYI